MQLTTEANAYRARFSRKEREKKEALDVSDSMNNKAQHRVTSVIGV
jgi:hypothetical protein